MIDQEKAEKEKTDFAAKRSGWLNILAFIHTWLLLAPAYPLMASANNLSGGNWWFFNLFSFTILGAAALSFYLIRMTRKLILYLAVSGMYLASAGYLAMEAGERMSEYAQVVLVLLTVILCLLVFAFRLNARLGQSRLQQDFKSQHEEVENVLLESWELPTFLSAPRPMQWIWSALLYIPAVMAGFKNSYLLMFLMMAADVFVMFLFNYLDCFQDYIREHHRVANMPVYMMKKVHRMLLVTALLLLAAAMIPAFCYHTEPLDGVHPDLAIELPQQNGGMVPEENTGGNMQEWINQLSEEDSWVPPQWLVTFFRVLMYFILFIAVLAIAWALWQRFRENSADYANEDQDEVIFLDEVAKENAMQLYGGKKKADGFLSPNAQIRRRFRRAIRKGTKGKPQNWETPEELENGAGWRQTEGDRILHELYEKARYSKEGCSSQDLGRLNR